MTRTITDKNAESIGNPIMEEAIQLLAQQDHAQLLARYPMLRVNEYQEKYKAPAANLKLLGTNPTIDYIGHLIKPDWSALLWKAQNQSSSNAHILQLELTEGEGDINLTHLWLSKPYKSTSENTDPTTISERLHDEKYESTSTPIIDNMLTSLQTANFELYNQTLPKPLPDKITERLEVFNEAVGVLKPMGNLISKTYLTHAANANLHTLYWKAQYEKVDEELLFKLTLTELAGVVNVHGFAFDK